MKTTNCYNCGSERHSFYAEENGFHLVKCNGCGLLYVCDRPEDNEITQAHKQGTHGGAKSFNVTGAFNPARTKMYHKVLGDLFEGELGDKGKWLDIGCGHGEFMVAVQKFAPADTMVKGTDPNVHKQASARKRGLDVSYFDIEAHEEKYDIISMLNVYSHLPDPPSFLETLKKNLKPHGELLLETGDTASLPSGDHNRPFYLPDHLSFVSESILVDMLERLGFEIMRIKKYPFMRVNLQNIAAEIVKLVLPQYKSGLKYFFKKTSYLPTDMFIRARLRS